MESKTNYTLIGVFIVVLFVGLLSAMLWLSVGFNQKSYSNFTVYLHEAASGLSKDAPVKFNGVQVGYVYEIKLNKNDPRQVEIILAIEDGTPITKSTAATLISQGITGVTYIGLSASTSDLTPIVKLPGEPYPVIPAKPSLFNQLDNLLKEVSESINNVSTQAKHIFNEKNARHVSRILHNVEKLTHVVAANSQHIDDSIKNADVFLTNIAKSSKEFPQLLRELQTGVSKFKTMADSLSHAGTSVSSTMGSGRNTLEKLSQETLAPASTLLHRLNAISVNLEKLSNEIRQNPSVVIRGSSAPKPGPGE
ncbi:MAG: MlaD family protein [Legionella sp.]|uniref:MlaD family protein n=1 Tax=Legionella sp. TaxID=459 RepID=UPI00284C1F91|nr:MlaD family protein [Legionella sp.]